MFDSADAATIRGFVRAIQNIGLITRVYWIDFGGNMWGYWKKEVYRRETKFVGTEKELKDAVMKWEMTGYIEDYE